MNETNIQYNPAKVIAEDFIVPEGSIFRYDPEVDKYIFYKEYVDVGEGYEHTDVTKISYPVKFIEENLGDIFTTFSEDEEKQASIDDMYFEEDIEDNTEYVLELYPTFNIMLEEMAECFNNKMEVFREMLKEISIKYENK